MYPEAFRWVIFRINYSLTETNSKYFSQEHLFSVKRANERRVFHGYKFAILSHSVLTPSKEILESIIKTGGGKLLSQIPSIKSLKQVKKLREEDPKSCHPGK